WTPEAMPATKEVEGVIVTLKSLKHVEKWRHVNPVFDVECDDASWQRPVPTHVWTDATGNSGSWLSPFEPAWKLHLRLRRRRDAEFPANAKWKLSGLAVPNEYSSGLDSKTSAEALKAVQLIPVDQSQTVDGIGLKVRYVAPASKIREENGTTTLSPP